MRLRPRAGDGAGSRVIPRAELDRAASWGIPVHVTVLYPFLPPDWIGPQELRRLSEVLRTVQRFNVVFQHVEWFGSDVVWLAPEPGDGFKTLTTAVWSAFPAWPPYSGSFAEVVPHLTVAARADPDRMRAAARAMTARLPINARVQTVHLFQGSAAPGAWHSVAELPLG